VLVIDADALRELVPMADAIDAVREAFIGVSCDQFWQPLRLSHEHRTLVMAAADADGIGTAVKVVSIRPGNPSRGLPMIQASVVWHDGESGRPTAVLDGDTVTALRTGAASGVATADLAEPDATVLAVIGAGSQAPDQVEAVRAVRAIDTVRIASRTRASADRLAARLSADGDLDVEVCSTAAEAVSGAHVVCCATPATEPLFPASALGTRVHINAVGSFRPEMRELGSDILGAASLVVVDQLEAAQQEAGELIRALEDGTLAPDALIEIGGLLQSGERARPDGVTVFKSVGLAAQDWAIARLAVARATAGAALESGRA
jgi:ornithine cyclodeaminase/alanine dehydrogenase-like protein (mu-crystallin family)